MPYILVPATPDVPAAADAPITGTFNLVPATPPDEGGFAALLSRMLPKLGGMADLERGVGLTGRALVKGALGIPAMLARPINAALGLPDPGAAINDALTHAGLPAPQTKAENLADAVTQALTGTGASIGAAGRFADSAATSIGPRIAEKLASNPAAQAVGATAASATDQSARDAGVSPTVAALFGLAAGAGAPFAVDAAANVAAGVPRFLSGVASPFTEAGQGRIVGATLNRLAQNPATAQANLEGAGSILPGSEPSTAQAARDLGLSRVDRALSSPDIAAQESSNNAARVRAFVTASGTPEQLQSAIAARSARANAEYEAAGAAPIKFDQPAIDTLGSLTSRPAFKDAVNRAVRVASDSGMPEDQQSLQNPQFLHLIKLGLDQAADSAPMDQAIGRFGMRGIMDTRNTFLDMLDRLNPQYAQARQNFAAASGPIDTMQMLQDAFKKSQMAAPDPVTGLPVLSQAKFKANVMGNMDEFGATDQQRTILHAIGADLDRSTVSAGGKAVGSNTMQNLATGNLISQSFGPALAEHPLAATLMRPLGYAMKTTEPALRDLLEQAMLDPSLARRLMTNAPQQPGRDIGGFFARQRGVTLGDLIGSAGQQQ